MLVGIGYGDGLYLAVSDSHGIHYTSSDGASWTMHSPPPGSSDFLAFTDLAFAEGRFVAAGGRGQVGFRTFNSDWTISSGFELTGEPHGFTCGDGRLVAVSGGVTTTSGDSYLWTTRLYPGVQRRVAYGSGRFVTGASRPGFRGVMTSTDGEAWTSHPFDGALNAFVHARGKFVGVGIQSIATSLDGSTWTARNNGFEKTFLGVAEGNGRFVSWRVIPRALGTGESPLFFLAYCNGSFFAIGRNSQLYRTTADNSAIAIEAISGSAVMASVRPQLYP